MRKVLIIGGEGYIGNVVSQKLLNSGYYVISYDNLLFGNNQCPLNKIQDPKYKFCFGDMLDSVKLERVLGEVSDVILLAGLVGDPITKRYPKESSLINDKGVRNVIDICSKIEINRFIFISTCSNYGLINEQELADEEFKLNPLSSYAKSKVHAEKYILSLKNKTKMCPTILRFATAFGLSPRMRFDLTVSEFTRELAIGNDLLVYDPETWRPYCHVGDFASLIKIVLEAPKDKVDFEVFNAGGDKNNSTKQMIVDIILNSIQSGNVVYQKQGKDTRNYKVDFSKVKSVFDFTPKYSIKDGVKELLEAIKNNVFENVNKNLDFFGNHHIKYFNNNG